MATREDYAQILRKAYKNRDLFEVYGEIVQITAIDTEALGQYVYADPETGDKSASSPMMFKETFHLSNGGVIVIHRRAL